MSSVQKRTPHLASVAFTSIMGATGYALRLSNIIIPLVWPAKISVGYLVGFFPSLWVGPIGGSIAGLLVALGAEHPIIAIPATTVSFFIVGLVAKYLRSKWKAGFLLPFIITPVYIPLLPIIGIAIENAYPVVISIFATYMVIGIIAASTSAVIERRCKSLIERLGRW